MRIKALRGTKDILPEEAKIWARLERKARDIFACFGFGEIRTPIMEESGLFIRSLGEGTDIVEKQMYTFLDRGERSITLRPEATASVVRAYLEHNMDAEGGLAKLFYIGPMFRAERPQAGRLRQFHQIGVEAIGSYSPHLDAEIVALASALLDSFEIDDYAIKLNSLGCAKDKKILADGLHASFGAHLKDLCEDCNLRYKKNILRLLDCKNEKCRDIIKKVFRGTADYLCEDCRKHSGLLRSALNELNINYEEAPYLVRGLDYYTKTAFEITSKKLGALDAIAGGGRYDDLVAELGGPQKGACGFAFGMDRIITALGEKVAAEPDISIFIATIGDEAYKLGLKTVMELRENGIAAEIDHEARSLKAQMRAADKSGAQITAILGEDEIKNRSITLRNMQTKEQATIAQNDLMTETKRILGK